jgi:acetyl esterase/lipase
MKFRYWFFYSIFLIITGQWNCDCTAQLPQEQKLWPGGILGNPVKYKEEKLTVNDFRESSLSRSNRVFSCVSEPTFIIHKPEKGTGNGVAMVICPGGGFRDVWFDREGNDFGLWLAKHGVTSLVLKYRTFNADAEGFRLTQDKYMPHVYADARKAISTLRSLANELGLDENKIGIGGFSAGGTLSVITALSLYEKELPSYANFNNVNADPDFVGLFYPGLNPGMIKLVKEKESFPPSFMINGGEDNTTPPENCIELYKVLTSKKFSTELHIYSKGGHGFDSGFERGYAVSTWRDSFIAWLKDQGFIKE